MGVPLETELALCAFMYGGIKSAHAFARSKFRAAQFARHLGCFAAFLLLIFATSIFHASTFRPRNRVAVLIPRGAFDVIRFGVALVNKNAFGLRLVQRFGAVGTEVHELSRDLFNVTNRNHRRMRMELRFDLLSRRRVDVIMHLVHVHRETNNVLLADVFNELVSGSFEPLFKPSVRERGLVVELVRRINYYALHRRWSVLAERLKLRVRRVTELVQTCVETRFLLLMREARSRADLKVQVCSRLVDFTIGMFDLRVSPTLVVVVPEARVSLCATLALATAPISVSHTSNLPCRSCFVNGDTPRSGV